MIYFRIPKRHPNASNDCPKHAVTLSPMHNREAGGFLALECRQ